MMDLPLPLTRELVLIGGGHAHALVLRKWGISPLPGARLTLINPDPVAVYTGMLPGFVAGHYQREELEIDLVRLARFAGARLVLGWVEGIDRDAKTISVTGRPPLAYDIVSINIGITTRMSDVEGFDSFGVGARPLATFAAKWETYLNNGAKGDIVVIGGGIGGLELAMSMFHALKQRGLERKITIVEAETPANELGDNERARLIETWKTGGFGEIRENTRAIAVEENGVRLENNEQLQAGLIIGVGKGTPQPWLSGIGLDVSEGFIKVGDTLQSLNDPDIFAAGDCAELTHAPRPKAGVFAVRAAPTLTHNLRARLSGKSLQHFTPQNDYLKLISLGRKSAFGHKWGRVVSAPWVWRWKDRIDQDFMNRLNNLPKMQPPKLPELMALGQSEVSEDQPICGGCGSKLGAQILSDALSTLPAARNKRVLTGPGDDAAQVKIGNQVQVLTTDHLRAFCDDPYLMARIAALHALGDIWAMGAQAETALLNIILPPLSDQIAQNWMTEILSGFRSAFDPIDVDIIGGHTTQGAELTLGTTLTGTAPEKGATTLGSAKPGDALILTRPIGSGVLLAAEMARRAKARDIAALWVEMSRSQGDLAKVLAAKAHAMTDVTGFGLAGHLMNILEASSLGAELNVAEVPVYEGTLDLIKGGTSSTLHTSNKNSVADRIDELADLPEHEVLFDPQTAGGFLATLPASEADILAKNYPEIRIIGRLTEGSARIVLT